MSSHTGVEQTLGLLNRLKSTVEDFAAREAALEQDFRGRAARESLQREQSAASESERLEVRLAEMSAALESAKAAVAATHARRQAWITRARTLSKEQTLEKIEGKTGARKYALQKQLMQAEKVRDGALAHAAATRDQFKSDLAREEQSLMEVEKLARVAFRGYGAFKRGLIRAAENPGTGDMPDGGALITDLNRLLKQTYADVDAFGWQPLPLVFRMVPVWVLLVVCLIPLLPALPGNFLGKWLDLSYSPTTGGMIAGGLVAVVLIIYLLGRAGASGGAKKITEAVAKAHRLVNTGFKMSDVWHGQEVDRIRDEFKHTSTAIDDDLKLALKDNLRMKGSFRETVDDKTVRVSTRNDELFKKRTKRLETEYAEEAKRLQAAAEVARQEAAQALAAGSATAKAAMESLWQALETEWKAKIQPIYTAIDAANAEISETFPPWTPDAVEKWSPPAAFADAAKFGRLEIDVNKLCDAVPLDARLGLPGPAKFALPLLLTYPNEGSILFEMSNSAREALVGALNNVILRLLANAPPGRLNFTIIDPVGLGQNFAGVMHLADYEAQIINSRIWTQTGQIEKKLADLNEHMEKVIQMYLRNEYKTIAEYNQQAGNIAEKYHFLVVADFPANFSETAVKRLQSIAASGARCGVYTLIHWDQRQPPPPDFIPKDFRQGSVSITARGTETMLTGRMPPGTALVLDAPPDPDLATEFVHKLGRASRDSSRVEVPFEHVAPPAEEVWTLDTTSELRVPIGRTGATKLQYLAIGKGTQQHALVAGKTGSGKSTLFHVIITNLALWCSPEQVEFYLVDFKKGVEFKCYASRKLPQARVVAIESDREFGLSVLQRVDDELRRRGDLFRKLGAQDVGSYKRAGGKESIPRSLLLIDEFQEFFVEDDKVSQSAAVLLDRIVRQGRAFGIHVILGSQTLGGAYTLARTTIGQMVIRIALQCNEADAYLIMDENNPAPRLLSRPGEGIYNDTAGSVEGNSPFQVVWLPEEVRDHHLDEVRRKADQGPVKYSGPFVFEGNAPADVRENELLADLLVTKPVAAPAAPQFWLGAPNSIKGPTEAVFKRQSGNHLIMVGQREEAALAMLCVGLAGLAAQFPKGTVRFVVFDGDPPGTASREYFDRVLGAISHPVTSARANDHGEIMQELADELKLRSTGEAQTGTPAIFIVFHGLQRFGRLRHEEDFSFSSEGTAASPGAQLNEIVTEGASRGMHVIATVDTYNNVNRWLTRKALAEFEMRVLFQMSVNDSASLIDSPKASTLGLNRALFYNEQEGYLETFRPYALPDGAWVEELEAKLKVQD